MGWFDWLFGAKPDSEEDRPRRASRGREDQPAKNKPRVGDRVFARWFDSYFYPAVVQSIEGKRVQVAYEDGDAAVVHRSNVRPRDLEPGSKIYCRLGGGPAFAPGVVREINGDKIRVRYDDGFEEWSTVKMVRVQREIVDVGDDPQPMGGFPGPAPSLPLAGNVPPMAFATGPMPGMQQGIIDVGAPTEDSNWRIGDPVIARWWDFYWYPGIVHAIGVKGVHVLYDDGDQKLVPENHLMPMVLEEGEKIAIRPKNQPQRIYVDATITRVKGDLIDVELEDGTIETNQRVARARFWRCPVGISAFTFEEGDRVLAHDVDGYIYPAQILTVDDDRVTVQFLDGPERMVTPELVRRLVLKPGLVVECRWKAGQQYFPGKIASVEGDRVTIHYDDGDKETTTIRLLRIRAS